MSVYTGIRISSPINNLLSTRTYLSTNVLTPDDGTYNPNGFLATSIKTGEVGRLDPFVTSNVWDGVKINGMNSAFYKGVYFQQSAVIVNQTGFNLGLVTEAQTIPCEIFATFSYKTTVASIGILDAAAGVSISGLSVSDTFYPYEEKSIDLVITKAGSPSINTYLYITFTGDATTYLMPLLGTRIEQAYMTHGPNWAEGVSVQRRFLTSVFSSFNGTESRKILRDRPSRTLEITVPYFTQKEAGRAWASLRQYANSATAHPWYPDESNMTQAPDPYRVYCPVDYRRLQAGGYAFLVNDNSNTSSASFELVRINTLLADGFTTDDIIEGTYVTGSRVYPALVCLASAGDIEQSLMTDFKAEVPLTLEEVYQSETLAIENASFSPTIKNSLPVLELPTTFSEGPSISISNLGDTKDSGRGFIQYRYGVPFVRQSATAICLSKSECWDCIGFFNYLRGRGKAFWMRSSLDFLEVTTTSTNVSFNIASDNDLADFAYLKYLWVQDSTGAFDIIPVITYEVAGDEIKISLDTNSLADISRVWQAHAVRLDEDVVTEDYLTDAKMLCSFSVMELQGV